MKLKVTSKIHEILKRDLGFAEFASKQLKYEMHPLEKKFAMSWKVFLAKFEEGKLEDDRIWFKWYALASAALDWDETKIEIQKALTTS